MNTNDTKLIIGFITYGKVTAKYLPYFLPSLKNQTYNDFKILAVDNTDDGDRNNIDYIQNNYPEILIEASGENLGFSAAYNRMINKAIDLQARYFFAINLDLFLESDAIEKLISSLEKNESLGSVSPKILRWNFSDNKKTNIIDSLGIKLLPGLRFMDIGQGEIDNNQNSNQEILGPSGAAAMYRISAFKKVANNGQYFDELMFMYKEDCDLAYRLKLAGFKSRCVNEAIAYHDRTVSAKGSGNLDVFLNRKNKSRQAKKWSFLNQQLIFWKFWRTLDWKNKLALVWYQIKILFFIIFFEPYLFGQLPKLYKLRKLAKCY
jgi:GT2 family glycosyltransferase